MIQLNPSSPSFNADPYPIFARMRAESPVCLVSMPNGAQEWFITRYADVQAVLTNSDGIAKDLHHFHPVGDASLQRWPILNYVNRHILFRDPPDHTRLRSLVNKAFTKRQIDGLSDSIDELSHQLLDRVEHNKRMDLVSDYGYLLPQLVIARFLGVPEEDQTSLRRWITALVDLTNAEASMDSLVPKLQEFVHYLNRLFQLRRDDPRDDMITALVEVHEAGDRLNEAELYNMVVVLIAAGFETVANFISIATLALLHAPEQRALFMQQPHNADRAINELLRFDGPVRTSSRRWASEDMLIGGQRIRKGELIRLVLCSANRDETVFENPDRLDLNRDGSHNLAFGGGIHYCLGATLARLEARIALSNLFARLPDLHLDTPPERLPWRSSILIRGLRRMPVAW